MRQLCSLITFFTVGLLYVSHAQTITTEDTDLPLAKKMKINWNTEDRPVAIGFPDFNLEWIHLPKRKVPLKKICFLHSGAIVVLVYSNGDYYQYDRVTEREWQDIISGSPNELIGCRKITSLK